MYYQFEWDREKAVINLEKHKISFERDCTFFKDPSSVSIFDAEHSVYENRWLTLGIDEKGVLLVVCHIFKETVGGSIQIRIISARKATKNEMKQYILDAI